jgi:hypothetical protein
MDPKRAADCVPIGTGLKFVLARKYFDAVRSVPFDRNVEAARDIQDVKAAQFRRQRFRQECPEVASAAGLFHQRLNAVLKEFLLQPEQVAASVGVVGIDCNPFCGLRLGTNRIQADCDVPRKVALNGWNVDA